MSRKPWLLRHSVLWFGLIWVLVVAVGVGAAQEPTAAVRRRPPGLPEVPLPDEPLILNTHDIAEVRLVVVARDLSHPWSLAFLPDGDILVTERQGRLRIIRGGVLDPEPISGVPEDVLARRLSGLMEVAVHPDFGENKLVYLTYM